MRVRKVSIVKMGTTYGSSGGDKRRFRDKGLALSAHLKASQSGYDVRNHASADRS
jgi:hypothetical protein